MRLQTKLQENVHEGAEACTHAFNSCHQTHGQGRAVLLKLSMQQPKERVVAVKLSTQQPNGPAVSLKRDSRGDNRGI